MFRKTVSILLLLIILTSFSPVASARADIIYGQPVNKLSRITYPHSPDQIVSQIERQQSAPECPVLGDIMLEQLRFIFSTGYLATSYSLGTIITADLLISFLEEASIAGFVVGGVLEPIDQAIEAIRDFLLTILIVSAIVTAFNFFAGYLIDAALELNFAITQNNPLIEFGGRAILQFANFGLVIAIIFIGIATILRLKKDELSADKLLIKLVVGIALVNLTIPAMSAIVNLGTDVTKSMFEASNPCPGGLSRQFTPAHLLSVFRKTYVFPALADIDIFNPDTNEITNKIISFMHGIPVIGGTQKAIEQVADWITRGHATSIQEYLIGGMLGFFTNYMDVVLGFFSTLLIDILAFYVSITISAIAALTFLALAIFLIIRYVMLTLLLIFSPLVWFGFIFKDNFKGDKGSIWDSWWRHFLRWVFFGPIIILFLAFTAQYLVSIQTSPIVSGTNNPLIVIGQLIAAIIISALGLYLASKFSAIGGTLVMAGVSGATGFFISKAQNLMRHGQVLGGSLSQAAELSGRKDQAMIFKGASRFLKTKGMEGSVGQKAKSLLGRVGIKPPINVVSEDQLKRRQAIWAAGIWSNKSPEKILPLSPEDIKKLPKAEQKAAAQAIYRLRQQHTDDPTALHANQVAALNKHEIAFASELANLTMKDVKAPPSLAFSAPLPVDDLNNAKNMFKLTPASVSEIVNNGNAETIEKSIRTILAMEKEALVNPSAFDREELNKLQNMRRAFNEKITNHIIDNLDPLTNPDSVFSLSKNNLSQISRSGTEADKKKVEKALVEMLERPMSSQEIIEWTRVDAIINILKRKGNW